jgi:hypothetical protein
MNLYKKEDLKGRTLLPREERELTALGGKNLWIVLTPSQYRRHKNLYRAAPLPEIIPTVPSDEPSDALRAMFGSKEKTTQEPLPPALELIKNKTSGEPAPLRRFMKRGIFGERL